MSKTENEIAVKDTDAMALPEEKLDMAGMMDEMEGLGAFSFDQVKIPSGGGLSFELPSDDPENPEVAQAIEGVIVHHQPKNVYFRDAFGSGETNMPDCSSVDGQTGVMTASGAEKNCATCKFNQFGSALKGNGKACQNRVDLYIMREGEMFPVVLSLPATSIKAFKDYLKAVVFRGKRLNQVVTKVSLKKAKSNDGIAYSTCVFKKVSDVDPADQAGYSEMRELCKGMALSARHSGVVDESTGEFVEQTEEDAALPFD